MGGQHEVLTGATAVFDFWLASDRIHPENTSCYIRGGEVATLYEEFRTRGVPSLSPFLVRP